MTRRLADILWSACVGPCVSASVRTA